MTLQYIVFVIMIVLVVLLIWKLYYPKPKNEDTKELKSIINTLHDTQVQPLKQLANNILQETGQAKKELIERFDTEWKKLQVNSSITQAAKDIADALRVVVQSVETTMPTLTVPITQAIKELAANTLLKDVKSMAEKRLVKLLETQVQNTELDALSKLINKRRSTVLRPYVWNNLQIDVQAFADHENDQLIQNLLSGRWSLSYDVTQMHIDAIAAVFLKLRELEKTVSDSNESVFIGITAANYFNSVIPNRGYDKETLVDLSCLPVQWAALQYQTSTAIFESQKHAFQELVAISFQRFIANQESTRYFQNILLVGPPGTGKTTLARFHYNWLKALRLINGKFIAISGRTLVGADSSESSFLVRYYMYLSLANVLFIDEAYTLCSYPPTSAQKTAVDELVYYLDIFKGIQTVIFGGYKDRMMEVYECNPGLIRRIPYTIELTLPTTSEEYTRAAVLTIVAADFPGILIQQSNTYLQKYIKQLCDNSHRFDGTFAHALCQPLRTHLQKVNMLGYGVLDVIQKQTRLYGVRYTNMHRISTMSAFTQNIEGWSYVSSRWLLNIPSFEGFELNFELTNSNQQKITLRFISDIYEENGVLLGNYRGGLNLGGELIKNGWSQIAMKFNTQSNMCTFEMISLPHSSALASNSEFMIEKQFRMQLARDTNTASSSATFRCTVTANMALINSKSEPDFHCDDTTNDAPAFTNIAKKLTDHLNKLVSIDQELFKQRVRTKIYENAVTEKAKELSINLNNIIMISNDVELQHIRK